MSYHQLPLEVFWLKKTRALREGLGCQSKMNYLGIIKWITSTNPRLTPEKINIIAHPKP